MACPHTFERQCAYYAHVHTHQLILVGSHRGEDRLGEYERFMLLLLKIGYTKIVVVRLSTAYQMYPRLISVHRIQNDLKIEREKEKNAESGGLRAMIYQVLINVSEITGSVV